jgi:hypothetical protein
MDYRRHATRGHVRWISWRTHPDFWVLQTAGRSKRRCHETDHDLFASTQFLSERFSRSNEWLRETLNSVSLNQWQQSMTQRHFVSPDGAVKIFLLLISENRTFVGNHSDIVPHGIFPLWHECLCRRASSADWTIMCNDVTERSLLSIRYSRCVFFCFLLHLISPWFVWFVCFLCIELDWGVYLGASDCQ